MASKQMTRTKTYIVIVPLDPPSSIPDKFSFYSYETGDGREFKDLSSATWHWFEIGQINYLRAYYESESVPGDGGTFMIYSNWDETSETWGGWFDVYNGEKADLSEIEGMLSGSEQCGGEM